MLLILSLCFLMSLGNEYRVSIFANLDWTKDILGHFGQKRNKTTTIIIIIHIIICSTYYWFMNYEWWYDKRSGHFWTLYITAKTNVLSALHDKTYGFHTLLTHPSYFFVFFYFRPSFPPSLLPQTLHITPLNL